jgi:hypothetical protein
MYENAAQNTTHHDNFAMRSKVHKLRARRAGRSKGMEVAGKQGKLVQEIK